MTVFSERTRADRYHHRFKAIAGLIKETKESTRDAVQTLCKF